MLVSFPAEQERAGALEDFVHRGTGFVVEVRPFVVPEEAIAHFKEGISTLTWRPRTTSMP
jgi:hypothetical protein